MQISPPHTPLALLVAGYGVLPRIWTPARPYGGGGVDSTPADTGGWEGYVIGPIMSFSRHGLELEMMGCTLRVRLASLGSRGGPESYHPLSPEKVS